MEWILIMGVLVALVYAARQKRGSTEKRRALREFIEDREEPAIVVKEAPEAPAVTLVADSEEPEPIKLVASVSYTSNHRVVEVLNDDNIPEFKYRFRANLSFDTPSDALRRHWQEVFIARPNGNRDVIMEPGGHWTPVFEWDTPEIAKRFEEEQFKYIGGASVYIDLLLAVRSVYESKRHPPAEKKAEIERICQENHNVYTVRHVFSPPWESLLVPVLSTGVGLGPHRVNLLESAGIKTISDIRSRSDEELLEIKGIGRAAVTALRNLEAQWVYAVDTEVIERDEEYRRAVAAR